MDFVREKVLYDSNVWWRCTFELVKDEGIWVIRPVLGYKVNFYSPLSEGERPGKQPRQPMEKEQFWAPHVHLAKVNDEKGVLAFANQWGLLGLWNVEYYKEPPNLSKRKAGNDSLKQEYSSWYKWSFPGNVRPAFSEKVSFQEPLETILKAVEDYKIWLDNLDYYRENKQSITNELPGCNPRIVFDSDKEKWLLDWKIQTLYDAIHLRVALDLSGKLHGFRRCKLERCNQQFLAEHETDKFCSNRCQNNYFAAESKRNKKRVLKLRGEGKSSKEIADETEIDIEKIADWIKEPREVK